VIIQSIGRLAPCCRVILNRAGQLRREGGSKRKVCFVLAAWLLWIPLTYAQGVGASGIIRGTITDPTGGLIPNVNVTVADPQTGLQRTVVTDSSGQYQFFGLPPATYSVTARISGFATEISKGGLVHGTAIEGWSKGRSDNVIDAGNLSPSQPLGFTAADAKREIQLGVRLTL
jgi:hypothetical protein